MPLRATIRGVSSQSTPAEEPTRPEPPKRRRLRVPTHLRWTMALVAIFFIVVYLVLPRLSDVRHSLNLLGEANEWWIVLAVVLEAASLGAYAQLTHTVLMPESPSRFNLLRVNMSSLAISHIMPGGTAPGTALSYRLLTELEVPGPTAGFGLAFQGIGSAVVLNAIFWFALLISISLTGYNPLYGFAALAGLALFIIFAGVVILFTRGQRRAADFAVSWFGRLPFVHPEVLTQLIAHVAERITILLKDRSLLRRALQWAALNWFLDVACLWFFLYAFGHAISPIDLLVAYGLANVLAVFPITPAGLGVIEGVLIPTLVGFHVPKDVAIVAVLSYRLVNFWLPIPVGGIAYLSFRLPSHSGKVLFERLRRRKNHEQEGVNAS